MIKVASSPREDVEAICGFFENHLVDLGLDVSLEPSVVGGKRQINISGSGFELPDCKLVLVSHLDTRDPRTFGRWEENSFNPYDPVVFSGSLQGVGALSGKINMALQVLALKAVVQEQGVLPKVALVGTHSGLNGMQGAIQWIRRHKLNPELVLISAPTDGEVYLSGRGGVTFEFYIPFSQSDTSGSEDFETTQSRFFVKKSPADDLFNSVFEYLDQLPSSVRILNLEADSGGSEFYLEFDLSVAASTVETRTLIDLHNKLASLKSDLEAGGRPQLQVKVLESGLVYLASYFLPDDLEEHKSTEFVTAIRSFCEARGVHYKLIEFKKPFQSELSPRVNSRVIEALSKDSDRELCIQSSYPKITEANIFGRFYRCTALYGPAKINEETELVSIDRLAESFDFYRSLMMGYAK